MVLTRVKEKGPDKANCFNYPFRWIECLKSTGRAQSSGFRPQRWLDAILIQDESLTGAIHKV